MRGVCIVCIVASVLVQSYTQKHTTAPDKWKSTTNQTIDATLPNCVQKQSCQPSQYYLEWNSQVGVLEQWGNYQGYKGYKGDQIYEGY